MGRMKFHRRDSQQRKTILQDMVAAGTNHDGQSNTEFAKTNKVFQKACESAGVSATPRQASKYRRGYGQAYYAPRFS